GITIAKKALTVTASSHNVIFGDAVPSVTPVLNGFAAGESAAVIDVLPACSTTYIVGSTVGNYQTSCSGGSDNNYSFTSPYAPGSVSVSSACSSFNGFLSPIGGANVSPNMSGLGGSFLNPLRTFKHNSTVPFKFTATCFGAPLAAGIQTLSAQKYSNGIPSGDEAILFAGSSATAGNQFRYTDGQWHFNFKANAPGDAEQGTWLFEATLFDGSKYNVWLAFRK
ncbi:MAG: MBG domain-containing protein, partial [Pyrinomonadaceae bacterium]